MLVWIIKNIWDSFSFFSLRLNDKTIHVPYGDYLQKMFFFPLRQKLSKMTDFFFSRENH